MTGPDAPYDDDGIARTSVLAAPVGAALAEALDALVGLDPVPGLAPLVRWAAAGEGVSLVHRLPLGARPLAQVRAEGPLRLGAAAAIGRSLVEPLRALHEAGFAHGAVGADTVLLTDAHPPGRGSRLPSGAEDGGDGDAGSTSVVSRPASTDAVPTSSVLVPVSTRALLAATGAGWVIPPGAVGGPDPAGDVAALAELVRHLVGVTPLPSGLVLVLLRCADDDPAMRPTLEDLDRALAACLLVLDEDGPARSRHPEPVARATGPAGVTAGSVLDRPRVLRPEGARPRRRSTTTHGRRRLALLGAAVVSALVLGRAVVAPALADVSAAPERLASATAPTVGSTRPATTAPLGTPDSSAGSAAPRASQPGPAADPAPVPPGPQPPSSAVTPEPAGTPTITGPRPREATGEGEPSPLGAGSSAGARPGASVPVAVDWAAVLTRLDGVRHAALVAGSRETLARAVDPDGQAWAADAALADRVRSLGARLVGGQVAVLSAELVSLDARVARLIVVDTRAAYAVTLDGSTARVPARAVTTWEVRLTRAGDGAWRIHDVRAPT